MGFVALVEFDDLVELEGFLVLSVVVVTLTLLVAEEE